MSSTHYVIRGGEVATIQLWDAIGKSSAGHSTFLHSVGSRVQDKLLQVWFHILTLSDFGILLFTVHVLLRSFFFLYAVLPGWLPACAASCFHVQRRSY